MQTLDALPHNLEAEQAFLGAVLVNNAVLRIMPSPPEPADFFEAVHSRIYEAALARIALGEIANPITLKTYFETDKTLSEIGGTVYLARLAGAATTTANAPEYGRLIQECASRRRIMTVADDMRRAAADVLPDEQAASIAGKALGELTAIVERSAHRASSRIGVVADTVVTAIQDRVNGNGDPAFVPSGLATMDKEFAPFGAGRLAIIAGRPSMGKSAVSLSLALNMAQAGLPVGFVSLEMSKDELVQRCLSALVYDDGAVPYFRMRRGEVGTAQLDRICKAQQSILDLPLYLDDQGGLTVSDIRARAQALKARHGLDALFVDYLGIVTPSGRYSGSRVNEVGEISVSLKNIAKELGLCVVAMHQLNRQVENRDSKRPTLADLRDSGNIEQDADVVMFLYREAYYLERGVREADGAERIELVDRLRDCQHRLEIIIAKNRTGPTGEFTAWVDMASNVMRDS